VRHGNPIRLLSSIDPCLRGLLHFYPFGGRRQRQLQKQTRLWNEASGGGDRPPAIFGLVVDYRDANGLVTDQRQRFALEAIGE